MNIPVEIVAAFLTLLFGAMIALQSWLVRRVFKLEEGITILHARQSLLIARLEEHFGFQLSKSDTDHLRKARI